MAWTLAGADADKFAISSAGVLTFKESPDYENPVDSGHNNVYNITVQVTDSGRNTASQRVTITVTNVEEPGSVRLSRLQPEVGISIVASLTDPDGRISSVRWQWYRGSASGNNILKCVDANSDNCFIDAATSATYSPVEGDIQKN